MDAKISLACAVSAFSLLSIAANKSTNSVWTMGTIVAENLTLDPMSMEKQSSAYPQRSSPKAPGAKSLLSLLMMPSKVSLSRCALISCTLALRLTQKKTGALFTETVSSEDGVRSLLSVLFQIDKSNPFLNEAISKYPWIKYTGSYFDHPFFKSPIYTLGSLVLKWSKLNPSFWQAQSMVGDVLFNCPTYFFNKASAVAGVPSWKLYFKASPYVHGASSFYFVGDSSISGNKPLADLMKDYLVSFVLELDPNVWKKSPQSQNPNWSKYTIPSVLHIDDNSVKLNADPDANGVCDWWFSRSDISKI